MVADFTKPLSSPPARAPRHPIEAGELLERAASTIEQRAAERDAGSERSMAQAVELFESLTGHHLTETDGWLFMVCLKLSRSRAGGFVEDDYLDAAAYVALAGESAARRRGGTP